MTRSVSKNILRDRVKKHFDEIAPEYDHFKHKASYYHQQVKVLLKELLEDIDQESVLEIGCGTGALLADLAPRRGLGVDISDKMIEFAKTRWKNRSELTFEVGEAETIELHQDWDIIIMADVLEHLYDSETAITHLASILRPETRLIITWANSFWSPLLHTLEWLKLKMPEGDHQWESLEAVLSKLQHNNFTILCEGTRCLIPAHLPLADRINAHFHRYPIIQRWGLIRYIVAQK